jgi:predicted DNA-binding protein YlxM (UPF0122 family)
MKIRFKKKEIDLTRYPFRGILSEIARERGVTRQAVQQAAKKGSLEILERIVEKVSERKGKDARIQQLSVYNLQKKRKDAVRGHKVRESLSNWFW